MKAKRGLSILILLLMLTALLPVTAPTAHADSAGWTVTNSGSTFTITRTDTMAAETVRYRTVSLSAFAGENFSEASGTLSFAAGESSKTVTVTERTASGIFQYAAGSTSGYRGYRFEVLDQNGFLLAYCTRSWQVKGVITLAASGNYDLGSERTGTFYSQSFGPIMITDDGYDSNPWDSFAPFNTQKYLSLPSTTFYEDGTRDYLYASGAELRMTLEFRAYEFDDGYQYLQVLTDNTSTCDNRSGCSDGDPGNLSLSRYMAGFEIDKGDKYTTYKQFTFPVLSVGSGVGASDPWGYGDQFPLSKQKFKSGCRAADGKIILNTNFNTLVLRLNASGSGDDDWAVNNVYAHITAVDETAPAAYNDRIIVSPGPYNRGNDFYISVPFTEIVIGGGTLNTSWGEAAYFDYGGGNVITFKGTIDAPAGTALTVTGYTGNTSSKPKDLFRNEFTGTISKSFSNIVSADPDYAITYDLAGGSVETANPESYRYSTADFTLTNPTRAGYTFAGWTGTGLDAAAQTVTVPTGSMGPRSYTAAWTLTDYTVTLPTGLTGGNVSADKTTGVHMGDTVTLTVTPDAGYALTNLTVTDGDNNPVAATNNQFTMPASDVTVTAEFQKLYSVTVADGIQHGTVTANAASVFAGDTITLTVTPDAGYVLDTLTVADGSSNAVTVENSQFTMPAANVTVNATFKMTWASLNAALQDGGTFTLPYDITAAATDTALTVPSGVTVTLDLNGHTLDRGLTAATSGGYVIKVEGTLTLTDSSDPSTGKITGGNCTSNYGGVCVDGGAFTMTGGAITNNSAKFDGGVGIVHGGSFTLSGGTVSHNTVSGGSCGSGVSVYSGSTFTMTGGAVSNNQGNYGVHVNATGSSFTMEGGTISNNNGGVYVNNDGTFTMTGGTITGNACGTGKTGGGVCVYVSTFNISGSPVITGNTKGENGPANNVYLYTDTVITVIGALTDTARIGVTMETPGVFTSGLTGNGTAANFASDNDTYGVYLSGGEAAIGTVYAVDIADGITGGTVTASPASAFEGDTVTLTVTPAEGYELDTLTYTVGEGDPVTIENHHFTMPAADVTVTAVFVPIPATAPTITTQPSALTLTYGYTTGNTLSVAASAAAEHTVTGYQWYSNTMNSTDIGTAISGATGASYTVPTGGSAGTTYYYCVVTATRADNSQTASAASDVATVTINPASVTLTANSGTEVYDGNVKTVTGFTSSVSGLTFTGVSASGSGTNAGDYDVTFTGVTVNETKDSTGNYVVTGTTDGTLTINPASVTLTANSSTEGYDGNVKTVTGFTSSVSGLTFTGVSASGSGTNAGSYDVTFSGVTVNETKDTTGNYVVTGTTNGTLTISKIAASVTAAPTAKTLTYTGSAQALVNAGTVSGGTMYYALGTNATTAPTSGTFSTAIPNGTNAQSYYVWYKVVGDANHSDTEAACVTVNISSAPFGTPTFKLPSAVRTIEESAFEGLPMTIVEIPSGCESIGKWAFRNCTSLTQIRIPASVTYIDDTAFDGCTVYVFAPANSAAETFCASHDNCVFVEYEG